MSERDDDLFGIIYAVTDTSDWAVSEVHDAILAAGYRRVFDGDCGLTGIKDPTERESAEAWMRWANLAMNDELGAIGAMKQMLTEFGYRKPAP